VRLILLLAISIMVFASEFPQIFSSAGDDVYKSMNRYNHIKDLDIYKDRPELLEAYCMDANATMQKGFSLDKMKDDPETVFDKNLLKEYARELRLLSTQNDAIISQLDDDVGKLYKEGDFESLKKINEAGFILSTPMMVDLKKYEDKKELDAQVKKINSIDPKLAIIPVVKPSATAEKPIEKPVTAKKEDTKPVKIESVKKAIVEEPVAVKLPVPVQSRKSKELQYYEKSLVSLKEELYSLRESQEEDKMACLNDITAINYWMIKVLENEKHACDRASAIKQMKSYDKASAKSCGRSSIRYVEWHGRIKPYVGQKLFEAEAGCHK